MELQDFIGIAIVGSGLSLLVQYLKQKLGTTSWVTKFMLVGLSLLVGGLYVWVRATNWYGSVLGVLGAASTFYAFFLKR